MDNPNGFIMNIPEDVMPIGMHQQNTNPFVDFSTGEKMRRGANPRVFDNNGGNSKAPMDAGVVNGNAGYGPITYGYGGQ